MAKAKPNGLIEQNTGPDPFYRDRDSHLIEVACNSKLSGAAKSIASILAIQYANREKYLAGEKRVAWPSAETLAQDLGLNPDTVKDGLKALEVYGHHKVDRPKVKGRGRVNGYRFVVKGLANGGEKTPIKNGGEDTPNSRKNGGLQPPKMGVKTPPELNEEQPEGAGARSRAPQAPEQTDVSFAPSDKRDNDQNSVPGDTDARERASSPDPASDQFEKEIDPDPVVNDAETDLEIPSDLSRQWDEADHSQNASDYQDVDDGDDDQKGNDEPDAPDAKTVQEWGYKLNGVAHLALKDLANFIDIDDPKPDYLLVCCSMFNPAQRSGLVAELPKALAVALAGVARETAEQFRLYLRHRLTTDDPLSGKKTYLSLISAIDAATPPPVKQGRERLEASHG